MPQGILGVHSGLEQENYRQEAPEGRPGETVGVRKCQIYDHQSEEKATSKLHR